MDTVDTATAVSKPAGQRWTRLLLKTLADFSRPLPSKQQSDEVPSSVSSHSRSICRVMLVFLHRNCWQEMVQRMTTGLGGIQQPWVSMRPAITTIPFTVPISSQLADHPCCKRRRSEPDPLTFTSHPSRLQFSHLRLLPGRHSWMFFRRRESTLKTGGSRIGT